MIKMRKDKTKQAAPVEPTTDQAPEVNSTPTLRILEDLSAANPSDPVAATPAEPQAEATKAEPQAETTKAEPQAEAPPAEAPKAKVLKPKYASVKILENLNAKITWVKPNPKNVGSEAHGRYARFYKEGMTTGEYIESYHEAHLQKMLARADLRWDFAHGFIKINDCLFGEEPVVVESK